MLSNKMKVVHCSVESRSGSGDYELRKDRPVFELELIASHYTLPVGTYNQTPAAGDSLTLQCF